MDTKERRDGLSARRDERQAGANMADEAER